MKTLEIKTLEIKKFVLGELATNCYLVFDKNSKEAIIIDPADEANFISEQILRLKLSLKSIVLTHGHFDHALACFELQLAFNVPVLVHQEDIFLLKRIKETAHWFLKREIIERPPEKIKELKDKEKIEIGKRALRVIATPGHSPGGVCLYSKKEKILFTGDTLFAQGVGRTDYPYCSKIDLLSSLKRLSRLPPKIEILPGHGESTTPEKALAFAGKITYG